MRMAKAQNSKDAGEGVGCLGVGWDGGRVKDLKA